MNNEKMMSTAAKIEKVLSVVQKIVVVAAIVCVVFMVLTPMFGEQLVHTTNLIELGPISYKLNIDRPLINGDSLKVFIEVNLALGTVMCVIAWFLLKNLCDILSSVKEGRPFESGISLKIKRLGWLVMAGGIGAQILEYASIVMELKTVDMAKLINPDFVTGYTANFTFSLNFLLVGFILFLLSYVFAYGEILQKESDETL